MDQKPWLRTGNAKTTGENREDTLRYRNRQGLSEHDSNTTGNNTIDIWDCTKPECFYTGRSVSVVQIDISQKERENFNW